ATQGSSVGFLFIKLISGAEATAMVSHAQAAYDLFPSDPGLNLFTADGQWTTPFADKSWIPPDTNHDYMRKLLGTAWGAFPRQFDDLPVTNVCGWGAPTWPMASVTDGDLQ